MSETPSSPRPLHPPRGSRFILLASVCVVVVALYFARDVFMPLALAMLISFLLAPLVNWLERLGLGRVPSVLLTVIVVFALVGILAYIVWAQVYDLANHVDRFTGNIIAKVDELRSGGGGIFSKLRHSFNEVQEKVEQSNATTGPTSAPAATASNEATTSAPPGATTGPSIGGLWTVQHPMPVSVVATGQSPLSSLTEYVGIVLGPLGIGGIVIVFVVFMLLQREDLRNRLLRLSGRGQLTIATQAFDDATTRISRYLTALAIVNGSYGVTIAVGLWLIGLTIGRHDPSGTTGFPAVILWGLLCAVLRFIPYIGPWIAAAFPVLIALAVYKGFGVFVSVVLLFVLVELGSNNFLEPWLYGASTGMSTVAILVSAVFWTWLWGPIGLVMATPLTVVLVVIGKYVPQLQFLDVLLGDEPAFEPPAHVYQRLLALDAEEALDLVQEFRAEMPLSEVYDTVLLPAMAMAERDRHKGLLDDRRQGFIRESMRDIIEEMGDQERARRQDGEAEREEAEADSTDAAASAEEILSGSTAKDAAGGGVSPTVAREVKVVCLPAHDEADDICNLMLGQLLEFRGYGVELISADALAAEVVERIEGVGADISIISALPPAAVAHARYLCKRIHARSPETVLVVGLWTMAQNVERASERLTGVHNVQIGTTLRAVGAIVDQLAHQVTIPSHK